MYLPILAFGQAMTSFVGQNIEQGQLKRCQRGKIGLLLGVSCSNRSKHNCIVEPLLFI